MGLRCVLGQCVPMQRRICRAALRGLRSLTSLATLRANAIAVCPQDEAAAPVRTWTDHRDRAKRSLTADVYGLVTAGAMAVFCHLFVTCYGHGQHPFCLCPKPR